MKCFLTKTQRHEEEKKAHAEALRRRRSQEKSGKEREEYPPITLITPIGETKAERV